MPFVSTIDTPQNGHFEESVSLHPSDNERPSLFSHDMLEPP
ncbi:hypothetical protein C942_03514 [Photobacterium marinum]|uniref:Uncharacterized protein n=1 Tax=Photobacterium marinum TaxID=1056511 RepID=L8J5L4_9GAMM|nr:hypothetical protein C942_03514 [Photobacterium marinum]